MIDLLVAGGGPAGLAAALHGARAGLRVVVVEPKAGIIDKACGEGLMPAAVRELRSLGVDPPGRDFRGITYIQGMNSVSADFASPGRGVRRLRLHEALLEAVERAGVERVQGRVTQVSQDERSVRAAGLHARWLIAADGLRSPIRAQLGLDRPARLPPRLGIRRHWAVKPWDHRVEVHWSAEAEAYVTPVSDEEVGVAFLWRGGGSPPYERLLAGFPALQQRLSGAQPSSTVAGAGPFERQVARRVAGRVLLVGDAAGYLDPLTGEGLRLGLESARAAVGAAIGGKPEAYEAQWRRLARSYWWSTSFLLWLARHPWTRARIVPVAAAVPGLMKAVLGRLGG